MNHERLKQARKASGFSLRQLADKTDLSHTTINKFEKGQATPNSTQLLKLASALQIRVEYLFRPVKTELHNIEYRKRSHFSKKDQHRIQGDILEQAERWQELCDLYLQPPIPKFKRPENLPIVNNEQDLESFANQVRIVWQLGLNPIPDLINMLESRGIIVIITSVESEKFDGLSAHIDDKPLIVISRHWTGDRQRFTLAHELGHLLLHDYLPETIPEEQACNRFAGAFLLPQQALFQQVGEKQRQHIENQELYGLKREFGLSMRACLYRLKDAGLLSQTTFTEWQKYFSSKGWHKQEPGELYPAEATTLFHQLVYRGLAEGSYGETKAAELLNLSLADFRQQRQLG